jgi:uncharacterized protein (TIGR02266 family)
MTAPAKMGEAAWSRTTAGRPILTVMQEKRKFRRAPLVAIIEAEVNGQPFVAEGRNISVGGMLVKTATTPQEGQRVRLEFCLPNDTRPIRVIGTVQHVSPDAYMGIRFEDLAEADRRRIEAYVNATP